MSTEMRAFGKDPCFAPNDCFDCLSCGNRAVPEVCNHLCSQLVSCGAKHPFRSQHVTEFYLHPQDLAAALAAALPGAAAARGVHGSVTVASVRSAPELYPFRKACS